MDDNISKQNFSSYLKKGGSDKMTGHLDVSGHKIINLEDPTSDSDATNKKYVDSQLHKSSHYKDEFTYLMSSPSQWTDEIDNRISFYPKKDN